MMMELTARKKSLLTLGALLFIFIAPMIAAWGFYKDRAAGLQTVNYGELLTPPLLLNTLFLTDTNKQPFPDKILRGNWLLFYISPVACGADCERNLYKMRQIRLALGKDQSRVQRMIITYQQWATAMPETLLTQAYTGTLLGVTTPDNLKKFLTGTLEQQVNRQQGGMFLADPHGNVILHYSKGASAKGMLKDLTRLLRVSQIG